MLRNLVRPAKFFRDLITRRKPIAIMIIVPYRIVSPRIHAVQGFSIPMTCPNEKNQKRNKETSTPALSPFLIRNLKKKNRTSVPANERPAGKAISPMGIGIVLAL
jgi:hypothetical protein